MEDTTRELALEALIELQVDGTTLKRARGFLAFEYEVEGKEATELLKEAGFTTGIKGGGLTDTIKFLEYDPRTEKELYDFIIESGTKNEARWVAQRNSIRLLSVSIYNKYSDLEWVEEAATAEQKAAIKAIVKA